VGCIQGDEYIFHGDKQLLAVAEVALEGRHNIANAMAALALGAAVKLPEDIMCATLTTFQGLEHRMQHVAEIDGVIWVNDSKATNCGACIAALQGYQQRVILIAGGDAKGADMQALVEIVKNKVKAIILMGKDAKLIERLLNGSIPVHMTDTVEQAVNIAAKLAETGESVLLSPACASLDQYKNYQERGEKFSAAVRRLAA
jgi:UDP-N-acetylmuramoylalanine--D-glutamate ligase